MDRDLEARDAGPSYGCVVIYIIIACHVYFYIHDIWWDCYFWRTKAGVDEGRAGG